jgi:hypothetical protein
LSAVALALVSGTIVSTYFAIDARRNAAEAVSKQKEAEQARGESEAVTRLLVSAF